MSLRSGQALDSFFGLIERSHEDLETAVGLWRRQFELQSKRTAKLVFTNGVFDLLHFGHVHYLAEARSLGDALVVAVNRDESVRRLKGPTRPIQNENDRLEILAALKAVDFVTWFSDDTPLQLIERLKPDVLVKGGDWRIDQIVGSDFVLKNGGIVRSLEFKEGRSTTSIVERIHSK